MHRGCDETSLAGASRPALERGLAPRFAPLVAALGLVTGGTWALGGCAAGPEYASGALCAGGPCAPAPKKPGHSLSSSVLCSCRACEPHACCEEKDTRDDDHGCPLDSYDFAANDSCALGVSSCESRCFVHRWRAPVSQGCQLGRPDRCCY